MTKFVGNSITFPKLSSAPSSPVSGDAYYDTTLNKLFTYNGTSWVDLAASGSGNTIYYQASQPASANSGDIWVDSDENTLGDVLLTDSTSSTSTTTAATPNSVKSAYDLAAAAVPKSTVTTAGDLIYGTGSAAVSRLALGTAGKVLTVNTGATAPEWAASGGMTLIATATPSAATSLGFSSIPTTYKHLLILYFDVIQSATNVYWSVRLNNDSGTGKHEWNSFAWTGSVAEGRSNENTGFGDTGNHAPVGFTATTLNQHNAMGEFWIYDYTNTSTNRLVRWIASGKATGGTSQHSNTATGRYITTGSPITQVDFIRSSTQTITGKFYLYGVS